MSAGRYLTGAGFLLLVTAAFALGGDVLRARLLPETRGALRVVATTVLGTGVLLAVLHVLGAFGWLRPVPVLAAAVVAGAAAALGRRSAPGAASTAGRAGVGPAAVAVGVVAAQWAAGTFVAARHGIADADSLGYHLPFAAEFARTGHVLPLRFTAPQTVMPYHPQDGELLQALGILGWHSEVGSLLVGVALLALTLAAVHAATGGSRGASALALAAGLLTVPVMAVTAPGGADTDMFVVAFLACSAAVILRASPAARPRADAVAAVAAGIAAGSKLTGLAIAVVLAVGAVATAPRKRAAVAGVWGSLLLATGSFWYLRDWATTGNPIPVEAVGARVLPLPVPDLSYLRSVNHTVANYLTRPRLWHLLGGGMHQALGPLWPLVLAVGVVAVVLALVTGDAAERVVAAAAGVGLVAYTVSPLSAGGPLGQPQLLAQNVRFVVPALVLGAMLLPRRVAAGQWQVALQLAGGALALMTVVTAAHAWPAGGGPAGAVTGLAVVAMLLVPRLPRPVSPRLAVAGTGVVVVAAAAVGLPVVHRYDARRFADAAQLWPVAEWARGTSDTSIGIVGFHQAFLVVGRGLTNEVTYLGSPGPHGSFDEATTCPSLRAAVRVAGVRYVVVAPGFAGEPEPPQADWLRTDPGVRQLLHRGNVSVFRVTGAVVAEAAGCERGRVPPYGVEVTAPPATRLAR